MHVEQATGTGTLMQIVDVLSDDQQVAFPRLIKASQCQMCRIGVHPGQRPAAQIVETMNQIRICRQRLWGTDVFDPVPFPKAAWSAECSKTAFRRNARAGQDHNAATVVHIVGHNRCRKDTRPR